MQYRTHILVRITCGLLMLIFVVIAISFGGFPVIGNNRDFKIDSSQLVPTLMCISVAIWAMVSVSRARTYSEKLLLRSIPIVLSTILGFELIGIWYRIELLSRLITPLYYLFSGLVVITLIVDAKNRAALRDPRLRR